MHVKAATVGVEHTFEVVTQTKGTAVIGLLNWCSSCIRHLLHRLPKSEPPTWSWGSRAGFCTATCVVAVYCSPPLCASLKVLRYGVAFWCALTTVGRLCQKPLGMVTFPRCKCPVVRVLMRGLKLGQRTRRWLVKTCQKLLLNSV